MISAVKPDEPASNFQHRDNAAEGDIGLRLAPQKAAFQLQG
jgi:hypothetical protein